MIRQWIKRLLLRSGWAVVNVHDRYAQDGLWTLHNDHFRNDAAFRAAYRRGLEASKGVDPQFEWRVHVALWAAAASLRVLGQFVECGVNSGFISSAIMHHLAWQQSHRKYYLIDTFSGPVLSQYSYDEVQQGRRRLAEEALASGAYVTDLASVQANFSEWNNAIVVQGAVPEVLRTVDIDRVAFLHLDMNCAYPERAALEFFWTRLSRGAIVLLDDYAYAGYGQQASAIDAAAAALGTQVLSLPTGQGLIVK